MSQTNASSEPLPILQAPDSEQSLKSESLPALDKDNSCLTADNEPVIRATEIAALRAFFELLDRWDRNERGE